MERRDGQHTPGPWEMLDNTGHGRYIDPGICEVFGAGRIPDANARLIAAAPDLLAALDIVVAHEGKLTGADWATIHAAVAKARGES